MVIHVLVHTHSVTAGCEESGCYPASRALSADETLPESCFPGIPMECGAPQGPSDLRVKGRPVCWFAGVGKLAF